MREMPCPVIPPLPDPKRLCKCAVSSSGAGVEGTNKGVLHPHVQHESTASAEMGAVSWELYLHHPTNHHRSLACRPRQTLPNILHTQHMLSQPPLPLNAILIGPATSIANGCPGQENTEPGDGQKGSMSKLSAA